MLREKRADIPHIRGNLEGYAGDPSSGGEGGPAWETSIREEKKTMKDETVARFRASRDVPADAVEVEPLPGGWLHVQIHRGERVKRFNLRYEEARQLTDLVIPYLLTAHRGAGRVSVEP
jgi:hypothetical protein